MFSFVFLIDLAVAALAWLDDETADAQPVAGLAVFGLLADMDDEFADQRNVQCRARVLFYLRRVPFRFSRAAATRRSVNQPLWGSRIFPSLSLALVLVPVFKLSGTFRLSSGRSCCSWTCWPSRLPWRRCHCWPVLIVLMLTLAALGELIFKIPSDLTGLPESFFLLGAFAIFFVVAGIWLARNLNPTS